MVGEEGQEEEDTYLHSEAAALCRILRSLFVVTTIYQMHVVHAASDIPERC